VLGTLRLIAAALLGAAIQAALLDVGNAAACAAGFWKSLLHSLLGVKKVVSEYVRELTHRGRNSGQYASGRFYECPTIGLVLPIAVI
jgi:hypothetical protein